MHILLFSIIFISIFSQDCGEDGKGLPITDFDIYYERITHNRDFHVDSFFDVFTELSLKNKEENAKSADVDSFFSVLSKLGEKYYGKVGNPETCGNFNMDSFFDVYTELSVDQPDFNFDSFFDVFARVGAFIRRGKIKARSFRYRRNVESDCFDDCPDSFFDIFVEFTNGLNSDHSFNHFRNFTRFLKYGDYPVDSFFDIFTELSEKRKRDRLSSLENCCPFRVDSFFDVFTELTVDAGEVPSGKPIVKNVYRSFLNAYSRTSPSAVGLGKFTVDSFFDIFTKIDEGKRLDHLGDGRFRIDSFFDVFMKIQDDVKKNGLWNTEAIAKALERQILENGGTSFDGIDSFFDVFFEIDARRRNERLNTVKFEDVKSYFDLLVKIGKKFANPDDKFTVKKLTNRFFKGSKNFPSSPDVFFDIFKSISGSRSDESMASFRGCSNNCSSHGVCQFGRCFCRVGNSGTKGGSLVEKISFLTHFSSMMNKVDRARKEAGLKGGDFNVDSFFDVFYDISGPGYYQIDSFFDVFTDVRVEVQSGNPSTSPVKPENPGNEEEEATISDGKKGVSTGWFNLITSEIIVSEVLIFGIVGVSLMLVLAIISFSIVLCCLFTKLISKIGKIQLKVSED